MRVILDGRLEFEAEAIFGKKGGTGLTLKIPMKPQLYDAIGQLVSIPITTGLFFGDHDSYTFTTTWVDEVR